MVTVRMGGSAVRGGARRSASKLRWMPATRKRTAARSPKAARKPARRARTRARRARARGLAGLGLPLPRAIPRLPELDQRQRDVLGLALVAVGVFIGFVLYGRWDGGRAGRWLVVALGWAMGGARELIPVALLAPGGPPLMRPLLPALLPLPPAPTPPFPPSPPPPPPPPLPATS